MIGGFDIVLVGAVLADDTDVLLRGARAAWPQAVLETGDGAYLAPIGQALRKRWGTPSEIFIYQTRSAYDSWTGAGLTDENAEQMVAVTMEADCISFVINDSGTATERIVEEMIEAVRKNRWLALAPAA